MEEGASESWKSVAPDVILVPPSNLALMTLNDFTQTS